MKNLIFKLLSFLLIVSLISCHKDLDRQPPNTTPGDLGYKSETGYFQVLAKAYGSMALTGNIGGAGAGDVAGIDEGTSDFLRLFWKAQELTTDEAVVAWNDPGIQDFHNMNWGATNPMLKGLYYRCVYTITLCNEFIRESADAKLSERGITGESAKKVKQMQSEVRFLRAFNYWVLLDLYGRPGFVTETSPIAKYNPPQTNQKALFEYIVKELGLIEENLAMPSPDMYGRVTKPAVWALLARIYLNAETYTNEAKYAEAANFAQKVIREGGYRLNSDYTTLMLADNNINNPEVIWSLNYDGLKTQNFGGTTFLVNASVGGDMDKTVSGLGGWGGLRTTKNLPNLFPDINGDGDKRAQFTKGTQKEEIEDISEFKDGIAVIKYRNKTRSGDFGSDPSRTFSDIDFPVFRLAEMYLIYAEAKKVTDPGVNDADAVTYLNELRDRAKVTKPKLIVYDRDYILDERARELYWEGFRRTDLIRFKKFTEGTYLWPWKGGVKNGTGVASYRSLFPIPDSEIAANPLMKQNQGY
jgi:hypothetical protein